MAAAAALCDCARRPGLAFELHVVTGSRVCHQVTAAAATLCDCARRPGLACELRETRARLARRDAQVTALRRTLASVTSSCDGGDGGDGDGDDDVSKGDVDDLYLA